MRNELIDLFSPRSAARGTTALAGALCIALLACSSKPSAPVEPPGSLASTLSGVNTVALVGYRDLSTVVAGIIEAAGSTTPPAEMPDFLRRFLDPRGRVEMLGFEPATAEGWRSVGVDPVLGIHAVLDARLVTLSGPALMFALHVSDEVALRRWLTERLGTPPVVKGAGPIRTWHLGDFQLAVGTRNGWTFVLVGEPNTLKTLSEPFAALIADTSPRLSAAPPFEAIARVVPPDASLGLYLAPAALSRLPMFKLAPSKVANTLGFVGEHVPGLGGAYSARSAVTQVVTSPQGRAALGQMFDVPGPSARFSTFVPDKGWAAVRLSVAPKSLLEGLAFWAAGLVDDKTGDAIRGLPTMIAAEGGPDWTKVSETFDGRLLVAVDLGGAIHADEGTPPMVFALGLRAPGGGPESPDPLSVLVGPLAATARPAGIDGLDARTLRTPAGPVTVGVIRGALVFATSSEAYASLVAAKDAGHLTGAGASMFDEALPLAWLVDTGGVLEPLFEELGGEAPSPEQQALLARRLKRFGGRFRLNDAGLLVDSPPDLEMPTELVTGLLAAVAIPAYMTYLRRAKTEEARLNLRKISDSLVVANAERDAADALRGLPASVGPTPAASACATGGKHVPDARQWAHPSWRTLGFAVADPHYFQYQLITSAAGFTARAIGDLNCNTIESTFELRGAFDADGNLVVQYPVEVKNELE